MAETEKASINPDVPYKIKCNNILVGFILHDVAYITYPEFTKQYNASVLFADIDIFLTEDYQLIQETDQKCIDAAYTTEKICNVAKK